MFRAASWSARAARCSIGACSDARHPLRHRCVWSLPTERRRARPAALGGVAMSRRRTGARSAHAATRGIRWSSAACDLCSSSVVARATAAG